MLLRGDGSVPLCHSPVVPIRQATAADVDRIRQLVDDAYSSWVPVVGLRPGPMDADYPALVAAGDVWVLTEPELVRGEPEAVGVEPDLVGAGLEAVRAEPEIVAVLVLVAEDDRVLMVENVAVDPGQQGRGIGPMLLEYAEEQARSRGLGELQLYTHELMASNIDLYNRLGWKEFERRESGGFSRVFFRKPVG
jgi:GNAT superfamily N-acetyltransferase